MAPPSGRSAPTIYRVLCRGYMAYAGWYMPRMAGWAGYHVVSLAVRIVDNLPLDKYPYVCYI